ncbi:MAG: glycine betaine/L-proline ABC transporter ATP-binding protein, partial [Dehalococcoidia bacterium]
MDTRSDSAATSDAAPADIRVSVRGLWKLFGPAVPPALTPDLQVMSKAELREQLGLVLALKEVSFDVSIGETFVVMGLSGSGKSTLVRTLVRLIEPTFGEILVDDEDILQYDHQRLIEFRRTKIAMVFQHFGLLPHRNVLENAAWGLEVQGMPKEERYARAAEVLALVGLEGWESYRPDALSGGMQQRVGLARAMAADPEVLLMDEPFSGLDPLIRRDMQNELVRLQDQMHKTIIFITHDLGEALKIGTHIAIMRDGEVIQVGTPEEILSEPADDYVEEFVRDVRRSSVVPVRSLMRRPVPQLRIDQTPKEAIEELGRTRAVAGFVVDDAGRYRGRVSFWSASEASQRNDATLADVVEMVSPHVSADASIESVLPIVRHQHGPLAVLDAEGKLVGTLVPDSVIHALTEDVLAAAEAEQADATPSEDGESE